jgi:hypothetical protein
MKYSRISTKDGKLRNLVLEILHTKKNNLKRTKTLLNEINKTITKESLIIQLRNEFNYIKMLNQSYKDYLTIIKKIKETYLKNKKAIIEYNNFLRATYKENVKIIDKYEYKIEIIKSDKKNIIKTNEEILKIKNDEIKILNEKLIEFQTKVDMNIGVLEKQRKIRKSLEDQLLNDRKEFMKKEEKDEKKYKVLIKKMKFLNDMKKQLEKTINYIDLNPTDKSNELEDELKADKLIMIENKNIQLKEEQIKNQYLIDKVKDLSTRITNISTIDESNRNEVNSKRNSNKIHPIVYLTKKLPHRKDKNL